MKTEEEEFKDATGKDAGDYPLDFRAWQSEKALREFKAKVEEIRNRTIHNKPPEEEKG